MAVASRPRPVTHKSRSEGVVVRLSRLHRRRSSSVRRRLGGLLGRRLLLGCGLLGRGLLLRGRLLLGRSLLSPLRRSGRGAGTEERDGLGQRHGLGIGTARNRRVGGSVGAVGTETTV